jgi:hypothetical protein
MTAKMGFKGTTSIQPGFMYAPYIPLYKSSRDDSLGDYWRNEDKQIVVNGVISLLKENGIAPMEPPDRWGGLDIAFLGCRIVFNLDESQIILFEQAQPISKRDRQYFTFSLYDPNCFEDLIKTIKSLD